MNPQVGSPATVQVGNDCYGATVVEVSPSGKTIKVQRNRALRNGLHVVDGSGKVESARLRNGQYRMAGRRGSLVSIGTRVTHRPLEV